MIASETFPYLRSTLEKSRGNGTKFQARCPAHKDKNPSLSVKYTDGKVLLNCLAGCDHKDVLSAIGLNESDLFDHPRPNGNGHSKPPPISIKDRLILADPIVGAAASALGATPDQAYEYIEKERDAGKSDDQIKVRIAELADTQKDLDPTPEVPVPLPDLRPVKRIEAAMIPESLRPWIEDISVSMSCPMEYPVVAALAALAGVIGTKIGVKPKKHDPWFLYPNLYCLVVGSSGTMKSDSMEAGFQFAREIDESLAREFAEQEAEIKASARDRKVELDALEAQLKKSYSGPSKSDSDVIDRSDLKARITELEAKKDATRPRLLIGDATIQVVGVLLNDNPRGLIQYQDEISGLFASFKEKERSQDRSFYLKAANGTGAEYVDRISRSALRVNNLCLTVVGGIQPGIVAPLSREAQSEATNDGLIPRFNNLVFPDEVPYEYVDEPRRGNSEARRVYQRLNNLQPAAIGFKQLDADGHGRYFMDFEPAAQVFFQGWVTEIEREVRRIKSIGTIGTDIPASHLAKYKSLMPKLALIFQMVDLVSEVDPTGRSISLKNAKLAAQWIEFYKDHARRFYSSSLCPEYEAAKHILHRLNKGDLLPEFYARDLYRKHWRNLSKPSEVNAALEILVEYGWLKVTNLSEGQKAKLFYEFPVQNRLISSANSANRLENDEIDREERLAIETEHLA